MTKDELLKMCEWGDYEIAIAGGGTAKREGWKFGYLATSKRHGVWTMTHLPSGFAFDPIFNFNSEEGAVGAMVEVAALKNSWAILEYEELKPISGKLREIAAKHGAISPNAKSNPHLVAIGRDTYSTSLNKGAVQ
jgi:hypothetical protein